MNFGPMFTKLFKTYPEIDQSKVVHKRVHLLTRTELYAIIKGIKAHDGTIPFDQPTRTKSFELRSFIYGKMS